MESHRSYAPDEADGPGHQSERGNPGPDLDRSGGEIGYASVPVDLPGGAGYGASPAYTPPEQRHGYDPGYRDVARPAEQQVGYGATAAPQSPPVPPGFTPEPSYGGPSYGSQSPVTAGMGASAPTSALPYVSGEGAYAVSGEGAYAVSGQRTHAVSGGDAAPGRPPSAGEARSGAPGSGRSAGGRDEETQKVRHSTEPLDRSALRRPPGGPGRLGDGVYRSRRRGTAVAIAVVTVLFELVALRLLAAALLASPVQVSGSIASSFLVVGLPMFGLGLYGLLSGAAAAPGAGVRTWLRAPLVYLPVGLALFVCAGLAAG